MGAAGWALLDSGGIVSILALAWLTWLGVGRWRRRHPHRHRRPNPKPHNERTDDR